MNIKKHISIFLAVLLLVSNIGFAFNVHYCGGKLASVSLNSALPSLNEKSCCKKTAVKKDKCCKDKKLVFQKKTENGTIKSFSFQFDYAYLATIEQPIIFTAAPNFETTTTLSYSCDANAPPLFKLYNQYLFYDEL